MSWPQNPLLLMVHREMAFFVFCFFFNFQISFFFLYFFQLFERTPPLRNLLFYQIFLDYWEFWWLGRNKQNSLSKKWLESHWAVSILCWSKWICWCSRSQACPWAVGHTRGDERVAGELFGGWQESPWLLGDVLVCLVFYVTVSVVNQCGLIPFFKTFPFGDYI